MIYQIKKKAKGELLAIATILLSLNSFGQNTELNKNPAAVLKHGLEQYEQGHFQLAIATLNDFLSIQEHTLVSPQLYLDSEQANYIKALAGVKVEDPILVVEARDYINQSVNTHNRERVAFELAKYFLKKNRDPKLAIYYYELAGISNLSNEEIADSKFELGYAYFITMDFTKARNSFSGIKDLTNHKYYIPANYYYGLLCYQEGDYDQALKSFKKVRNHPDYKDIVPYYEAEIFYFKGDYDQVLEYSKKYLRKKGELYYDKEMRLLTGQTLFELKRYEEALPYLEEYYQSSQTVRKEELYELAYTYYQLGKYSKAIETFQPLSNANDNIGQMSMYLLGDCFLKTNDKKGARNAFGFAKEMDHDKKIKEESTFLYDKLSYELGYDQIALNGFKDFINIYPQGSKTPEAKSLLSALLLKSNQYGAAFDLLEKETNKSDAALINFQKSAVGKGIQLFRDKEYKKANKYFDASLQNPKSSSLEAVAYFWKGESDFQLSNNNESVEHMKTFLLKVKGQEEVVRKISAKATVQNANVTLGYASLKKDDFATASFAFSDAQKVKGEDADLSKDALIRQADAAFMQKDFQEALKLYNNAIVSNSPEADYAKYQKALILGLTNNRSEKMELLKQLQQNAKGSVKEDAILELANEYVNDNRNNDAVETLNKIDDKKASIYVKTKASYLKAYALQSDGQNDQAIKAYRNYIVQYPTGDDRKVALTALANLYSNKPEEYEKFLTQEKITDVNTIEIENTYYDAGENEYGNRKFEDAVIAFQKYLDKYPKGNFYIQANFYAGESYFHLQQNNKAKPFYEKVLEANWNDFSEDAALRMAEINLKEKNYTAAKLNYNSLLEHNTIVNTVKAYEGMMKISFEDSDYESVETWAEMLKSDANASVDDKLSADLYLAKSLKAENKFTEALTLFQQVEKANAGIISIEARYELADILFIQKDNVAAEKATVYAAQTAGGNDYWAVKSYLLLADIFIDNGDNFNAKAILSDIIKNGRDPGQVNLAKQKLEIVKKKESSKTKLK
ncbi:MAG TPA: tetratricopeptide repeat protein [Edaphocola sp.]|nr:tetratricopeptide repeat protein [Edaphocola sp.]